MEKRTIGIVGCGLIADTHVEAIRDAAPERPIAVCDPLPGKAELLRRKYGLKAAYTRMEDLLAVERPVAAHILSPPHLHVAHARLCLAAGCHVLVEKPLCFSLRKAQELYALAEREKRVLCVDHSLLFQPSVRQMLQALEQTPGAQVLHVNCFYGLEGDGIGATVSLLQDWKRRMTGGAVMDTLVHPVTLAVALSGTPTRVQANFIRKDGQMVELLLSWQSDHTVVALSVSVGAQPFRRITEVVTSAGTFTVDHSTEVLVHSGTGFGPRAVKKLARNFGFARQLAGGTVRTVWQVARGRIRQNPGARALIAAFYRHLDNQGPIPVSRENALNTVQVLEETVARLAGAAAAAGEAATVPATAPSPGPSTPALTTLVTGASGFLGRNLCDLLLRDGRRKVIAQVRRGPGAERLPASPLLEKRFVDFRWFSAQDYATLLQGVDEVVNCAHAAGARTWEEYRQQNCDATLALFEAARNARIRRFVHLSSVAVYGVRNRRPNRIDEGAPIGRHCGGWDFYIRSKALADTGLRERAANGGTPLAILRPGILYSVQGERLLGRSIPTSRGRLLIEFGRGKNRLPFTRVDVLAGAIHRILDMDPFPTGVYNVTGRCEEPVRVFRRRRVEALGIRPRFLSLPIWPLRLGAGLLELAWWLARRKQAPKLTRYILDSARRDLVYDCLKAERAFGWDVDEAISAGPNPDRR